MAGDSLRGRPICVWSSVLWYVTIAAVRENGLSCRCETVKTDRQWFSHQYLSAVRPVGCRLVWVRSLQFGGFWGQITSKWKIFENPCAYISIHVLWPNLVKIGRWEVAEKSSLFWQQKTPVLRESSELPFCPSLGGSRPKFREHRRLVTCACVPNLVQITWSLSELFLKDWFFRPQKSLQIQPTTIDTYSNNSISTPGCYQ